MEGLFALLTFFTVVVAPLPLAGYLLAPMKRAAVASKGPTRYMLTDTAYLVLLLSIGGGVVSAVSRMMEPLSIPTAVGFIFLFYLTAIWWAGAQLLSRVGVTDRLRRAFFLLLICPYGVIGSIALPAAVMLTIGHFVFEPRHRPAPASIATLLAVDAGLVAAVFGCHAAARWIARDATAHESPRPDKQDATELALGTHSESPSPFAEGLE